VSKIDLQYDLVNLTPASASPPQANFNRIEQHINQELIERGGTVAMEAQLKLVGDPVQQLDAAPKQYVDAVLPIGIIMMFGGASAPPGGRWAICNGAELQTTTYPELFAVIGTNFGGTGGRFNLPNMVDRVPMGNGGLAAIGATGGVRDAVVPNHTHPIDHNHPTITTGTESVYHVHNMDHYHNQLVGTTGTESANHTHNSGPFAFVKTGFTNQMKVDSGSPSIGVQTGDSGTSIESTPHTHSVNGATNYASQTSPQWLNTGNQSVGHTHSANVLPLAGTSGAASGGVVATDKNLPPYIGVAYIMRVM